MPARILIFSATLQSVPPLCDRHHRYDRSPVAVMRHALTIGNLHVAGIHRVHRLGNIRAVAGRRQLEGGKDFCTAIEFRFEQRFDSS